MHIAKFVIKCKYFDNHIVSHALAGSDPTPANSFSIFPCIFPPLVSWSFSRRCVQNYLSVKSLPQITVALHNSGKLCPPLNWRRELWAADADADAKAKTEAEAVDETHVALGKTKLKFIYIFSIITATGIVQFPMLKSVQQHTGHSNVFMKRLLSITMAKNNLFLWEF